MASRKLRSWYSFERLGVDRWLARLTLDRLLVGTMLLIIGAAAACTGMQSDTWWQLRSGQWTLETRQVWLVDPFSSTARGSPWPNHEWLSQVIMYIVYLLAGLRGLVALYALVAMATWWAIYQLCAGASRYRVVLLLAALPCQEIVWAVRPHMLTLLLLAIELLLIRRGRLWLLPPVFLLWANVHGGVVVGGAALLVAAAVEVLIRRCNVGRWLLVVALCAAATLVTPMGLGLWWFSLSMLAHPETAYIQEWLPPSLGWPLSYPFFVLAIVWVAVVALRWRQLLRSADLWLVLVGLVLLLLGFRAIRHTALFAVAALPLVSLALPNTASALPLVTVRRGVLHLALGCMAALACLGLVGWAWSEPQRMAWSPFTPEALAAVRACPGTLYNTYNEGGALMWFVPERSVFVDSRNDPYTLDLLYEAVIAEQRGEYHALFARYSVGCALVASGKPIDAALSNDTAWREQYRDARIAIFQSP